MPERRAHGRVDPLLDDALLFFEPRIALRVAREDGLPLADRHAGDGSADHDLLVRAAARLGDGLGDQRVPGSLAQEDRGPVRLENVGGEPHDELEEVLQGPVGEQGLADAVHRLDEISDSLGREAGGERAGIDRPAARDLIQRYRPDVQRRGHVGDAGRGASAPAPLAGAREDDVDAAQLEVIARL